MRLQVTRSQSTSKPFYNHGVMDDIAFKYAARLEHRMSILESVIHTIR